MGIIIIGLPYIRTVDYLDIPDFRGLLEASALVFFSFLGRKQFPNYATNLYNIRHNMQEL
ncbi:MAG: hypothetical protein ACLFMM_07490 [Methanohalobium sp.]|uniref:hypothetical protein n=1 Tax=Methanohalobium sp. TaxID=2837493 RepID=UPI003979BDC1